MTDGRSVAVLSYFNAGLPVDHLTPDRETPLFAAVQHGQRNLVEALLARGANVNPKF
ncbi:MAG: ankyrin repeat domain-containing protein [Acidobacteriia bacterium]|nr:ankyrin repeat domain-containing protein [Terriglobia bacterium]